MNPSVSVIVCTYNQDKYIRQTIDSILTQECSVDFELLIGDDCSSDGTEAIIAEYATKYPDIIYPTYNEQNVGASTNLVQLINKAKGGMISICDGDDFWLSTKVLQHQWDILNNNNEIGMVCGKAKTFDESTQKFIGFLGSSVAESLEEMLLTNSDVAAPTIAFKTDLLRKCIEESSWYIRNNCFYDSIIAYWFAYNSKIKFIDEELAAYRVLPESACHSQSPELQLAHQRRYFSVKWRFILEHNLPVDFTHEMLLTDYNQTVDESKYFGEVQVRNSKRYKLGEFVFKIIKRKQSPRL